MRVAPRDPNDHGRSSFGVTSTLVPVQVLA